MVDEARARYEASCAQRTRDRERLRELYRAAVVRAFAGLDEISFTRERFWTPSDTESLAAMLPFLARRAPLGHPDALAVSARGANEQRLRARSMPRPGGRRRVEDDPAMRLPSEVFALERLTIAACGMGDDGCMELSRCALGSATFGALRLLNLADNRIRDRGAAALAAALASAMSALQELTLSLNRIGDVGMHAFADEMRQGSLPALATLRLDSNALGERSMRSLGRALAAGSMVRLSTLDLAGNQIRDAGLMILMREACERGKALMHLMHLDVSANQIGKGGSAAARQVALSKNVRAGSPPVGAGRDCDRRRSAESDGRRGAQAAADSTEPHEPASPRKPAAKGNDPGIATLAAALAVGYMPNLTTLALSSNAIGDDGASALAVAALRGGCANLHELWLCDNRITAVGATALANAVGDARALPCLTTLALSGNASAGVEEGGEARVALTAAVGAGPKSVLSLGTTLIDGRGDACTTGTAHAEHEPLRPKIVSLRELELPGRCRGPA